MSVRDGDGDGIGCRWHVKQALMPLALKQALTPLALKRALMPLAVGDVERTRSA